MRDRRRRAGPELEAAEGRKGQRAGQTSPTAKRECGLASCTMPACWASDVLASYTVPCTMPVRTPASPSDMSGLPAAPSAPRLLPALGPLADAGLASFMLPTPLLPEFSSPHFSLSLLPTTLSTQSCFLDEPLARGALLRGTSTATSRDHTVILGPARRCAGSLHQPTDGCW